MEYVEGDLTAHHPYVSILTQTWGTYHTLSLGVLKYDVYSQTREPVEEADFL